MNDTLQVESASTSNFCFTSSTIFSVSGSTISILAVPLTAFSDVLDIRATIVAWSPTRTKRGMFGCTITFLLATALPSIVPLFMPLSCASPIKRHVVTLSGRVNFTETLPVLSVWRAG